MKPPSRVVVALVIALVFIALWLNQALASGVVGTGTPDSCTEAALNAAPVGGGTVTFNCGSDPATITVTAPITVAAGRTIPATSIDGGGLITISGGGTTQIFINPKGASLALSNLTLSDGFCVYSSNSCGTAGGVENAGKLAVANSTFSGNTYRAIYNEGRLSITNSAFSGSTGGAIYNQVGRLSITNSTFSGNTGGAIWNLFGRLIITNSTFSGNTGADEGGAIYNEGWLTITDSTFLNNSADLFGGAIENAPEWYGMGKLTVTNSTFSGNVSNACAGAIHNYGGAITLTNSTFSGNVSNECAGGAILNEENCEGDDEYTFSSTGKLIITNSTFSDNLSIGSADSPGSGGAVHNAGKLTVTDTTFVGNSSDGPGGGIYTDSVCGCINRPCPTTLKNTIVANSAQGGTCAGVPVKDGGHNLDEGMTCGFKGAKCGGTRGTSICNAAPMLDPAGLANNGGPTQTIAVESGSPAINAAGCKPKTDQRGYKRPGIDSGTGMPYSECTIGAYEFNSPGCPSGLTACGALNICTNLNKDPANCGTCGNVCAVGQKCSSGTCE